MDISRMELFGLQNVANEIIALLKRLEKDSDSTDAELERLADMLGELVLFFPELKDFEPKDIGNISYRLRSTAYGTWRIQGTPEWNAFKDLAIIARHLWNFGESYMGGLAIHARQYGKFDARLSLPYEKTTLPEEIKNDLYPILEYLCGKHNPNNKYRNLKE